MKIINALLAMLMATFSCAEQGYLGAVEVQVGDRLEKQSDELITIGRAAERNKCGGDDFFILLAIRRAENGGWGREFGIKHRLCKAQIEREPQRSLDIQAGWAAATIVKSRRRWEATPAAFTGKQNAGVNSKQNEFIDFLADRYCPASADPKGNINWKINVKFFYERLKGE